MTTTVFASSRDEINDETQKIELTQNQENILRAYGLTDKEIEEVDKETIREILKNGTIVDSSRFAELPDYDTNDIPKKLEKAINEKGLSERQIKGLRQMGYLFSEIAEMDIKTIEALVGTATYATKASPPSGYNYVASVPDSGGTNEYFHPNVSVTTSQLNWYVSASKEYAKHIFNLSSNPVVGTYSYYLYGEWDGVSVDADGSYDGVVGGTHEGVDVKHATSGKAVYNATEGVVKRYNTGGSLGGYIQIYDDYLDETITYMHVSNTGLTNNQSVSTTNKLGYQSTSQKHVHFQAYDGQSTSMPSGKDDTLGCRIPYGFMTWYI